jgi:hypothetical protein
MPVGFGSYHDRDILHTKGSRQLSKWQQRPEKTDSVAVPEKKSMASGTFQIQQANDVHTAKTDQVITNFDRNEKKLIGPEISMDIEPNKVRAIFGPPRSGTSFLQRMLCQNSNAFGIYEPARTQLLYEKQSVPDYRPFFKSLSESECHPALKNKPNKTIVLKEALGNALSSFEVDDFFPSIDSLKKSRPVFIFREPISTFESIKRKKWYDIDTFVGIYKKCYKSYLKVKSIHKKTICLTYEELVKKPENTLEKICKDWGLKYEDTMVPTNGWKTDYFKTIHYHHELQSDIETAGIHNSLLETEGISKDQNASDQNASLLSLQEKSLLETELTPIYEDVLKDSFVQFGELEQLQPDA